MRLVALLLCLSSVAVCGDRVPFQVTCRPVFKATEQLESKPRCVTIDGIDYDLDPILAEHKTDWTWPGGTEQSLREHLKATHKATGLEALSRSELAKLHAVLHDREQRAKTPQLTAPPVPQSRCPGGVCPIPSATRTRRGFFLWR